MELTVQIIVFLKFKMKCTYYLFTHFIYYYRSFKRIIFYFRLDEFYSHVDFGEKANGFLSKCGVKAEPSYIDYVELLTNSSVKLWKLIGNDIEKYLSILRNIASSIIYIRNNPKDIISAMKKAPVLVGITKEKENIDSEIKETKRYHLVSAENVFICDDESYRDILNPITAPVENILENFYKVFIKLYR